MTRLYFYLLFALHCKHIIQIRHIHNLILTLILFIFNFLHLYHKLLLIILFILYIIIIYIIYIVVLYKIIIAVTLKFINHLPQRIPTNIRNITIFKNLINLQILRRIFNRLYNSVYKLIIMI